MKKISYILICFTFLAVGFSSSCTNPKSSNPVKIEKTKKGSKAKSKIASKKKVKKNKKGKSHTNWKAIQGKVKLTDVQISKAKNIEKKFAGQISTLKKAKKWNATNKTKINAAKKAEFKKIFGNKYDAYILAIKPKKKKKKTTKKGRK